MNIPSDIHMHVSFESPWNSKQDSKALPVSDVWLDIYSDILLSSLKTLISQQIFFAIKGGPQNSQINFAIHSASILTFMEDLFWTLFSPKF